MAVLNILLEIIKAYLNIWISWGGPYTYHSIFKAKHRQILRNKLTPVQLSNSTHRGDGTIYG